MKNESLETKQTDLRRKMNHFANYFTGHRLANFIFFMFLYVCSSAQAPKQVPQQSSTKTAKPNLQSGYDINKLRQKDDSIVTLNNIAYKNGVPSSSKVSTQVYRQTRLIFEGSVDYDLGKWTDSASVYIKYDSKGRMTNVFRRRTENGDCVDSEEYDQTKKNLKSKATKNYCPITYTATTECFDSLQVTHTQNRGSNSQMHDSVWFHTNGLKKREVTCSDNVREQLDVYSYQYGPDGHLQTKSLQIYRHKDAYLIFNYVRRGHDTVNISYMDRANTDTTIGSYSLYLLDTVSGKSRYWWYLNGKLNRYTITTPFPNNSGYSMKIYEGDTTNFEYHIDYIIQKDRPGLSERWVFQPDNNNYTRIDSVLTNGLLTIKTYASKYTLAPGSNVSIPTSKCKLSLNEIYDEKRRIKEIKEYDYMQFKLLSVRRYSYSR
ncbi:MAG: hypothetical protein IT236_17210 [Bacteroidia bacterium]|nr:hypothetical protein [Bacteroidia bacterium]